MDLGLKGKRALATGSTAGIGFALAKRLAQAGALRPKDGAHSDPLPRSTSPARARRCRMKETPAKRLLSGRGKRLQERES